MGGRSYGFTIHPIFGREGLNINTKTLGSMQYILKKAPPELALKVSISLKMSEYETKSKRGEDKMF